MKGTREFLRDLHREQRQLLREGLCTPEQLANSAAARRAAILRDRALPVQQRDRLTKDVDFGDEPTYTVDDVLGELLAMTAKRRRELERETLRVLRELHHSARELLRYDVGSPSSIERVYEIRRAELLRVRRLRTTQRAIDDARAGRLSSSTLRQL